MTGATWRTSSHNGANTDCVEVAFLESAWRKSSFSSGNTNCVEVAPAVDHVGVRDSKNVTGPVLAFPATTWREFLKQS
ncbi:MAG TPA: DUF397 domain-containing protein [Pseudonocardiaceae bacterium]|jgi:hypothetical protein|nr:DUF397 domain-containing protein [Pseudonocardiaceae bacterium]